MSRLKPRPPKGKEPQMVGHCQWLKGKGARWLPRSLHCEPQKARLYGRDDKREKRRNGNLKVGHYKMDSKMPEENGCGENTNFPEGAGDVGSAT